MPTNDKKRLGYLIAREWLWANYFFWAGTLATAIVSFYLAFGRYQLWNEFLAYAIDLEPFFTVIPYAVFSYGRAVRSARRIVRGNEVAPEISHDELKEALASVQEGSDESEA